MALSTHCRKCGYEFDETNTAWYSKVRGGRLFRHCANCRNWRRRVNRALRDGLPIPPLPMAGPDQSILERFFRIEPHEYVDHSRCEPGGAMCGECSNLWMLVQSGCEGVSVDAR